MPRKKYQRKGKLRQRFCIRSRYAESGWAEVQGYRYGDLGVQSGTRAITFIPTGQVMCEASEHQVAIRVVDALVDAGRFPYLECGEFDIHHPQNQGLGQHILAIRERAEREHRAEHYYLAEVELEAPDASIIQVWAMVVGGVDGFAIPRNAHSERYSVIYHIPTRLPLLPCVDETHAIRTAQRLYVDGWDIRLGQPEPSAYLFSYGTVAEAMHKAWQELAAERAT